VARGFYAKAIAQWTEVFGADRLLVLQYERCVANMAGQLARTFDHLGLTRYHVSRNEIPLRPGPGGRTPLDPDVVERLVDLYRPDVDELCRLVPDLDLILWPHFSRDGRPGSDPSSQQTTATPRGRPPDRAAGSSAASESSPTTPP
jgi:hypothetical protein